MRARGLVMTQDLTHFRLGLREIPAGGLPGILVLLEFEDLVLIRCIIALKFVPDNCILTIMLLHVAGEFEILRHNIRT